jgi:hypothetical protein
MHFGLGPENRSTHSIWRHPAIHQCCEFFLETVDLCSQASAESGCGFSTIRKLRIEHLLLQSAVIAVESLLFLVELPLLEMGVNGP